MLLYLKNLFLETWQKTNTESIEFINKQKGLNPNVIIILIYTSICLACTNYMGNIYLYTEYLNNHSLYFNPTCTTKSVKSWLSGYYFFKLVNGGLHTFLCP